jgi:hypothetical protein
MVVGSGYLVLCIVEQPPVSMLIIDNITKETNIILEICSVFAKLIIIQSTPFRIRIPQLPTNARFKTECKRLGGLLKSDRRAA